jgi:hypothetical protein
MSAETFFMIVTVIVTGVVGIGMLIAIVRAVQGGIRRDRQYWEQHGGHDEPRQVFDAGLKARRLPRDHRSHEHRPEPRVGKIAR